MEKRVLFLFLIISTTIAFGQTNHPKTKQEIISMCAVFMVAFKENNFDNAFQTMKNFSVIEPDKLDSLENQVRRQMPELKYVYGKILGFEELSEKDVKSSMVKLIYLLKFEKYYLKFSFILYNNGSFWTVTNFRYTDEIDDLF